MKNIILLSISVILITVCASCSSGEWVSIGEPTGRKIYPGVRMGGASSFSASIVLDSSDKPIVVWVDKPTRLTSQVFIKRWDGNKWVEIGKNSQSKQGISNSIKYNTSPSVALDLKGFPIVAWRNRNYNYNNNTSESHIYIKRWNGNEWVEIGEGSASGRGIINNSRYSPYYPSLAVDSQGNPVVVMVGKDKSSKKNEIYVKRWNGNKWVELGEAFSSGKGVSISHNRFYKPRILLDSSDGPVIAWAGTDDASPFFNNNNVIRRVYIKRWDGNSWVRVGNFSAPGVVVQRWVKFDYDLALDSSGNPYLAWFGKASNDKSHHICVKKWNGKKWVDFGRISNNLSIGFSLAIDSSDKPVLSWVETVLPWVEIDPRSKILSELVLPPRGVGYSVFVKRWNGYKWVNVGEQPLISGKSVPSIDRTLIENSYIVLDSNDNPVILWESDREINIKRFVP